MNILKEAQRIHMVGVGGIGMSGLARLLLAQGKELTASDLHSSETTQALQKEGISIHEGHSADNLEDEVELLIYSEAIPEENAERQKAEHLNIESMNYFEALGLFAENYQLLAIAGTHGKTSTTAMLALILIEADFSPTVLVGSTLKEFNGKNVHLGESEIFLVEACEYRRNFLPLKPNLLGITNMELDHVDYFKSREDYEDAFKELASQSEEVIFPEEYSSYEGELAVPGEHNRWNAGLAASMARRLGTPEHAIQKALSEFTGTWRRFEFKGELNGAPVYDDYAHHPTEIIATLDAARERHPDSRIIAVFQPHQYSRALQFKDDLAEAFEEADEVIIPNIYESRDTEEDKAAIDTDSLVATIGEHHENVMNGQGLEATAEYLSSQITEEDLLIVMGAGDVNRILDYLY